MSGDYRWVRFRTCYSAGAGNWQWREIAAYEGQTIEDILNDLDHELTTRSEHWRGVEGDFDDPPADVLQRRISVAERKIEELNEAMARWTALLLVSV